MCSYPENVEVSETVNELFRMFKLCPRPSDIPKTKAYMFSKDEVIQLLSVFCELLENGLSEQPKVFRRDLNFQHLQKRLNLSQFA